MHCHFEPRQQHLLRGDLSVRLPYVGNLRGHHRGRLFHRCGRFSYGRACLFYYHEEARSRQDHCSIRGRQLRPIDRPASEQQFSRTHNRGCALRKQSWQSDLQHQPGQSATDHNAEQASGKNERHDEDDCLGHDSGWLFSGGNLQHSFWNHTYARHRQRNFRHFIPLDSSRTNIQAQRAARASKRLSYSILQDRGEVVTSLTGYG